VTCKNVGQSENMKGALKKRKKQSTSTNLLRKGKRARGQSFKDQSRARPPEINSIRGPAREGLLRATFGNTKKRGPNSQNRHWGERPCKEHPLTLGSNAIQPLSARVPNPNPGKKKGGRGSPCKPRKSRLSSQRGY